MYRVVWKRIALGQLAAIWTNATDQNAVTAASHAIDQALATDPEQQGSPGRIIAGCCTYRPSVFGFA